MLVLGIESSCDETAAAVVDAEGVILAEAVHSQIAAHAPYGGVVPEIAARDHLRAAVPVVRQTLAAADVRLDQLDAIAVTCRPGLVGALLVGMQMAKGLAWSSGKPLIGVDHLIGHLLSVFLRRSSDEPASVAAFPFVGLLVSGGHSALYRCDGPRAAQIRELGATRDDAVGEAYDKVAKLLGLGYPGGPVVDRLAAQGDYRRAIELAPPMLHRDSLEMSFSGLKSAVARHVRSDAGPRTAEAVRDLCAAFQRAVTITLVNKAVRAAQQEQLQRIVVAGGVAANRELRARLARACAKEKFELALAPLNSCTDNAAMIAYAGACKLAAGEVDDLTLAPAPRTELPRITRKGSGKRKRRGSR